MLIDRARAGSREVPLPNDVLESLVVAPETEPHYPRRFTG
jgi:hypothetical protein